MKTGTKCTPDPIRSTRRGNFCIASIACLVCVHCGFRGDRTLGPVNLRTTIADTAFMYVDQRYQDSASLDISPMLEPGGMRPRTTEQPLSRRSVRCQSRWTCTSDLELARRRSTTYPRRCRSAIVSMLMHIAGCHLKWNKSTARDRFTAYRTIATFVWGSYTCMQINATAHSSGSFLHSQDFIGHTVLSSYGAGFN